MKNSKGITLASLVVMIASIILLSGMAIGFGYRYLSETKEADEKYFKEVLSNAIIKRENNYNVNSSEYPRIGLKINSGDFFEEITNNIPALKEVNREILYTRGEWYIVDYRAAKALGVKGSDAYIDVLVLSGDETVKDAKLALADYNSGIVYIFTINGAANIKDTVSGDLAYPDDGHKHDWNLEGATCTEDKKCLICGYVVEVALGHEYGGEFSATPIDDEFHYKKECTRCGAKGGYERHKDLNEYAFYESGDGEWYHYNGCEICGWPSDGRNYELCNIEWKRISDEKHVKYCTICNHEEEFDHIFEFEEIDENYHREICKTCGFIRIKFEPHEDSDDEDYNCDKCGCEIIENEYPILINVELKNKEYPESKYVTDKETIELVFKADKMIEGAIVTICGYGGDNITYTYSADKLTCTAELYVDDNIVIAQNSNITFTINCRSVTTGEELTSVITQTTSTDSYLIYDSVPPLVEYINKDSY